MARWLVQLVGNSIDLEEFPLWFPDGECYALSEDGHVYITGGAFEALADANQVYEAALQALDEFSAVIALLWPNFQRPSVGKVYREGDDGRRQGNIFLKASIQGRSKARAILITGVTAHGQVLLTQAQKLLAGSRVNTHLQIAISLWADPLRTWPRLYRILEEIEKYLEQHVSKAGFCSHTQRKRFRQSANAAEIAGKDARHAQGSYDPPKNPMNIEEAKTFVAGLLQATLNKAASKTESANKIDSSAKT